MVMGTASTMACLTETLGLMLPGGATAPSGPGDRLRNAVASGRTAARLAGNPIRPREILTKATFENAIKVLIALGGSMNAIIHLTAIARRANVPVGLADFDRISREVPLLVNCKPSGEFWLQDMHHSGGVPVLLKSLQAMLDLSTAGRSCNGSITSTHLLSGSELFGLYQSRSRQRVLWLSCRARWRRTGRCSKHPPQPQHC